MNLDKETKEMSDDLMAETDKAFQQHLFKLGMITNLVDNKVVELMLKGMYEAGVGDGLKMAISGFGKATDSMVKKMLDESLNMKP